MDRWNCAWAFWSHFAVELDLAQVIFLSLLHNFTSLNQKFYFHYIVVSSTMQKRLGVFYDVSCCDTSLMLDVIHLHRGVSKIIRILIIYVNLHDNNNIFEQLRRSNTPIVWLQDMVSVEWEWLQVSVHMIITPRCN